ncbi:hypothetical protein HDV57DRAFT_243272 [Trichoderma longibrachiatum]
MLLSRGETTRSSRLRCKRKLTISKAIATVLQVLKLRSAQYRNRWCRHVSRMKMRIREPQPRLKSDRQTHEAVTVTCRRELTFWGAGFSLQGGGVCVCIIVLLSSRAEIAAALFRACPSLFALFIRWLGKFWGWPAVAHVSRCRSGWLEDFGVTARFAGFDSVKTAYCIVGRMAPVLASNVVQ